MTQKAKMPQSKLLLASFGLMSVLSASAYANIVIDGDFEAAAPGAGPFTFFTSGMSIDGGSWTVTHGTVGVDTQNWYNYDGSKSVFLDGDASGPDSLTQILTTIVGVTYTVGFWANADTVSNTFAVTFGGVRVNGAPTSIAQNGFPSRNWLGNSGEFTYYSGTAMATSTSTPLVFTATNNGGTPPGPIPGVTIEIDNVTVVPEPTTLALLGVGLAGLGYSKRSKQ